MIHLENYWKYSELVETSKITIYLKDITKDNWQLHHDSVFNIMLDTIELDESRHYFVHVIFESGDDLELSLYDYWQNLIFWYLQVAVDRPIEIKHLMFEEVITQKTIKNYIDTYFIPQNRVTIDNITRNNIIDNAMYNFVKLEAFSAYLANTINLSDFVFLMKKNKEVYDIIHSDFSNIPLSDNKKVGMEAMGRLMDIIKEDTSHCLSYFVRAGEGLTPKQAKEVLVNIGTKPDGLGGVYPYQINTNYVLKGVDELVPFFIESSTARLAQIIIEKNTGDSGHLARLLGLNNMNAKLHDDPNYVCDCDPSNYERIVVENKTLLNSLAGQYYRLSEHGIEKRIEKDDTFLIGKEILLASPMTCASAARGEGICYRCYGYMAYVVNNINIGKIAAEIISSEITQRMLSAKHLIETEIKKISWVSLFLDLFDIEYNLVRPSDDINLKDWKISINLDNIYSESEDYDDEDSLLMNNYISEFDVIDKDGNTISIHSEAYDSLYLTQELEVIIDENRKKAIDGVLTLSMSLFEDIHMFAVRLENNDLIKVIDKIKSILDRNAEVAKYDKNSILQSFLMTTQECNLKIHAIHAQVLLMNQIRSKKNIHEQPKWEFPEQDDYQLLTLKKSLESNPSVTVSLMFQNIKRILTDPMTFVKTAPGITDLFFMEQPQDYLPEEYTAREEHKAPQVLLFEDEDK